MGPARRDFVAGFRDVLSILPGFVPFGVITGVTAVGIGMTSTEAVVMSATVFGGAAQLAAIDVMDGYAPLFVVVFTGLMVNLRFGMFSASIAPYFHSFPRRWKWVSAFLLTTPSFVLSVPTFEGDDPSSRRWYYLGVALPLWINWQVATISGVVLGTGVPDGLQLEFVIPLVFMVLLFKMLEGLSTWMAAATAGFLSVVGGIVPMNLGIVVAAIGGVSVGLAVTKRWQS